MKRVISLLLAMVMSFGLSVSASAVELEQNPIMPRYTYIASTLTDIYIEESTNISSSEAFFVAYDQTLELQIELKLQRYNNSKWNTVKTWTSSGYGEAYIRKDWAVPSGYTYRAYATFKVYDSNGNLIESVSHYDSQNFPAQ